MNPQRARLRRSAVASVGVVIAALALIISGCGGGGSSSDASTTTASGLTTVTTPSGSVQVPVAPKRVVVVDYYSLPDLLEVGFTPIGAPADLADGLLPDQLAAYKKITKVGTVSQLNFEAIDKLDPDLIIGVDSYNGGDYATLSKIAPTVLVPFASSGDWPALAATVAGLVGESDRMDALKTKYEERAASIKSENRSALATSTWDIVSGGQSPDGSGTTYAWLANSTTGGVMTDAGFRLGTVSGQTSENGFQEISYEQLGRLSDATGIIVGAGADGKIDPSSKDLVAQPVFRNLPATKADAVFPVRQMFPASYGQAMVLLDGLEAAVQGLGR